MSFKRWSTMATAMLTVLVLAACGGGGGGQKVATIEATPAAMRRSVEATLQKGTSKIDMSMLMTIQGKDVTMKGTGALDPANKRYQLSFDAKDLMSQLAPGTSVPPEAAAMFKDPITVVLDGTVMYMHFPALAKLTGGDKEWLKIDIAKANESAADLLGAGGGGAFGSDPSSFLQFLEGAGKVTQVGKEDVRGASATHFTGSYTMKDALAALPEDQREKAEKAFKGIGLPASAEEQEIPFDVWIGDDGLVHKMSTAIDFGQLAPAGKPTPLGKMSMNIEYFDFGAPVDISVPSDDEVKDFSELLGGTGRSESFETTGSSISS